MEGHVKEEVNSNITTDIYVNEEYATYERESDCFIENFTLKTVKDMEF